MDRVENLIRKNSVKLIPFLVIIVALAHYLKLDYRQSVLNRAVDELKNDTLKLANKYEEKEAALRIATENISLIGKEIPFLSKHLTIENNPKVVGLTREVDPPFARTILTNFMKPLYKGRNETNPFYFTDFNNKSNFPATQLKSTQIIERIQTPIILIMTGENKVISAFHILDNIRRSEIDLINNYLAEIIQNVEK